MPNVKIPPVLRTRTGGAAEVATAGGTVGEVLEALASAHPETREQLFGGEGDLNRYVNVYLNDEDVRVLDGLDTPVAESDTVVILPAMAGGQRRQINEQLGVSGRPAETRGRGRILGVEHHGRALISASS
jgi:sulfur-carrier protein